MTKRILVVDDEPDIGANLADILSDRGFNVDVCNLPHQALKHVDQNRYDFALIDFRLPEMDGVELFQQIHRQSPEAIGFLVTGYANPQTQEQATRSGFRHIMSKPVDIPKLLDAIQLESE